MDDKKRKITGVLLIFAGIMIAAGSIYNNFFRNEQEEEYSVNVEKIKEYGAMDQEVESGEKKTFEMKNVTDSMLEELHTDEQKLSEMIQEWLNNNMEYGSAVGVEFYDMEEESNTAEKCSVMMRTVPGEEQREEARRILILDYYKELEKYNIHP